MGAEAVSRWDHPALGQVPPALFIPIAEQSDLIERLTRTVIRDAAAATAGWVAHDPGWVTWINACPRLIERDALSAALEHHRALHGLAPASLGVEITEQDLGDPDGAVARISRLAQGGVRIAVDDFGTGHSSLARLRDLPVDAIKIDRSFVRASGHAHGARMLAAVADLGHAAGKLVVAEGVESADELRAVRAAGCDRAGGHLFGPTTPAEGLPDSCTRGRLVLART